MTLRPLNPFRPFEPFRYGTRTLASQVRALFAAGEQGWWYDPSDLSTLYQDSAGTTPVTAMEQNVGLILDKRLGLVLGPELVTNGGFATDTDWTKGAGWAIGSGVATKTAGSASALTQTVASSSAKWYRVTAAITCTAGTLTVSLGTSGTTASFTASANPTFYILAGSGTQTLSFTGDTAFAGSVDNISVRELPGNHAYQPTPTKRMKVSRRVNLLVGTAALATQSITTVAGGHTFKFSGAGSVTLSGTATGTYSAGAHSITCTAGTLTVTVTGAVTDASLVPTIKAHLPYQLVNSSTDYDDNPAKFPTYLKGDLIDDCYVTNDIDLTATDKINVWAGITKLSDAAVAMVYELSSSIDLNSGTISSLAPSSAGQPRVSFASKGTASSGVITTNAAAPISTVATGIGDISGDVATLLLNGTQAAQNTADQGTGNYGKYPLNIGARNQTSLFFGGEIYSLIGRGALSNASQHAAVNQYIKQRMMLP